MIAACWMLSSVVATASAPASGSDAVVTMPLKPALRLVVGSEHGTSEIPVAFAFATSVVFPVDCSSAAVGDPEWFGLAYNKKLKTHRRYTLTVLEDRMGAVSNVAFDCDEGVSVTLQLRQVPPEEAVVAVSITLDPKETARVRRAVEKAKERADKEMRKQLDAQTKRERALWKREIALSMLERFAEGDDVEYGRQDFVIARPFRQVVIGNWGFVLVELTNHTGSDVQIKSAAAFREKDGFGFENPELVMRKNRIGAGETATAAVRFDLPAGALETVKLVFRDDGSRVIEVSDVEL